MAMDKYLDRALVRLRRKNRKRCKIYYKKFSYCVRCHTTWNYSIDQHSILYTAGRGHFALCGKCWNSIDNYSEKIYYYTEGPHSPKKIEDVMYLVKNILKEYDITITAWLRKYKLEQIEKVSTSEE